jgi:hypothetical protein
VNDRQPLWLPRGSVRAIIALGLTAATIYGVLITLGAADASVPGGLAALLSLDAVFMNTYFNDRKKEEPA